MKYSKSKPLSTSILLIFSLSVLYIVLSIFIQIIFGLGQFTNELKKEIKLYVYVDDSLSLQQVDSLKNQLQQLRFVDKEKQNSIVLTSKDQIAKDFLSSSHEDYQNLLGDENPFKNLLTIDISNSYKSSVKVDSIANSLRTINGIYEVTYPSSFLHLLIQKTKTISVILFALALVIILITYFQISNYIRLVIHSNRVLIKSMQLLGSTDSYIRKPYLLENLKNVFLSSIIGIIVLNGFYFYLGNNIPEINAFIFSNQNLLIVLGLSFVILFIFSFVSTIFSINKYLSIQRTNLF